MDIELSDTFSFSMRSIFLSPCVLIKNFLPTEERDLIHRYIIANEKYFQASSTTTAHKDYRKSIVLYDVDPIKPVILDPLREILPDVCDRLGMQQFEPGAIECQITSTGNGGYFKRHKDDGCELTASRRLTYVYYLREPNSFEGGLISFYRSQTSKLPEISIEPEDNSLLLFRSSEWHEVSEVRSDAAEIGRSRLTVNGWVRG